MHQSGDVINAAIVGANGYSGRELARLLLAHPNVNLHAVFARDPNWQLTDELPEATATAVPSLTIDALAQEADNINTLFLATPHEASMTLAAEYAHKIPNIIDLSGAFRLTADEYPTWYDLTHSATNLLDSAQYGLSPWSHTKKAQATNLIANPGCYATAVLMALLPLLQTKLVNPNNIIIDAKSGLTGAGRKPTANLLLTEIAQDFYPYKVGQHQHQPEISRHINTFTQQNADLVMMTHLLPIKRGISTSIYLDLTPEMARLSDDEVEAAVQNSFESAYQHYPLVKFGALKTLPSDFLSLNKVVGSCRSHIAFQRKDGKLLLFSTIDNLLKGAASQAVENFNWIHGLAVTTALAQKEGVL